MPYKPSPLQCTHYKPLGQQIPVTRKAHETMVSPHRKFQNVSRAARGASSFLSTVGRESVSNSSFAGVTARDFQVARYRRPKQRVLPSKPFVATTTSKTDFQMEPSAVLKAYEKPRKCHLARWLSHPSRGRRDVNTARALTSSTWDPRAIIPSRGQYRRRQI